MPYRKIVHQIELAASPARVFEVLHTPSAIRQWWGATRAIVIARAGGIWVAAWGEKEDDPDYVTAAVIAAFEPPRRLFLTEFKYYAKSGPLPFEPEMMTEFNIEPSSNGAILRVVQDRFPADRIADELYAGCQIGWKNTFEGIKNFLMK